MKAYVTYLEAAGARVVPLILGEPEEVTMEKLSKLNGVFLPGGGGSYTDFGRVIMERIVQYNDDGVYYPVFGVCLGYENMMKYAADAGVNITSSYILHETSLPLEFVVDTATSSMWADLGAGYHNFETEAMTYNSHGNGIDPEKFTTDLGLAEMYRLTSISYLPEDGRPFTATVEAWDYPFFGTQFHPEKSMAMFNTNVGIDHSWVSLTSQRYLSDHFMQQARQNTNYWGDFSTVQ